MMTRPLFRLFDFIVRADPAGDDRLALGRSAGVRDRRAGHVRRERRPPDAVRRVRRIREDPVHVEEGEEELRARGVPIGPARQSWIFADANAASGPAVTGST